MILKQITAALLILTASVAFALEDPLKSVEKIKTMTADFTQINTIKDFGDDEYKGRMVISSGEKALWDYTEPVKSWYLFSKDSIEQYDGENNQLIIYGSEELSSNVLLQILLDLRTIKSKFDVKTEGSIISLTPKENMGIKDMTVTVKDGVISEMKSRDNAGNVSRIIFGGVKINAPLPENAFSKKAPKDADVFRRN